MCHIMSPKIHKFIESMIGMKIQYGDIVLQQTKPNYIQQKYKKERVPEHI